MLYLESPAGVGFSYSDDKNYTTDDDIVSMDNYLSLLDFFKKFPQFKTNPFFVTGESYGGIYVPTLSERILKGNSTINMKGFAVGNGLLSHQDCVDSQFYYAFYHALFGEERWHQLQKYCCVDGICNFYDNLLLECNVLVAETSNLVAHSGINMYSLYDNCTYTTSKDVRLLFAFRTLFKILTQKNKNNMYLEKLALSPPCIDANAVTKYLNMLSVRQALHIPGNLPNWTVCSEAVNKNYSMIYKSLAVTVSYLLQNYRAMIYNGDTDLVCNFLGDQEFVEMLGLGVTQARRFWKIGPQTAGSVKDFKQLSFVTVKGAGHMVPEDKPSEAFKMFSSFLANKPLN